MSTHVVDWWAPTLRQPVQVTTDGRGDTTLWEVSVKGGSVRAAPVGEVQHKIGQFPHRPHTTTTVELRELFVEWIAQEPDQHGHRPQIIRTEGE